MIATYKLNANEVTVQLIELIKKNFPGKEIEITVLEQDATEYLKSSPANEQHINQAIERIEKNEGLVQLDIDKLNKK
jgi:hypothetical protein